MLGAILERKPTLFSVTACAVMAIPAVPVMMPHMLPVFSAPGLLAPAVFRND